MAKKKDTARKDINIPDGEKPISDKESPDSVDISVDELQQLKDDQIKSKEYFDQMLRIQAEFDNYRKRVTKEKADLQKFATEGIFGEILPILDNFERSLNALEEHVSDENRKFFEGVELIYRQFNQFMEKNKVEIVKTVGEPFDPCFHNAVQQVPTDEYSENTVMEELSKGYILNGKLIRAATVVVSKALEE